MDSSSIFGIILGGLINGIEKEGFINTFGESPLFLSSKGTKKFIQTLSNLQQSLFFIGNGSKYKSFPSLKNYSYILGSYFSYFE
jgi:hypothetical protein